MNHSKLLITTIILLSLLALTLALTLYFYSSERRQQVKEGYADDLPSFFSSIFEKYMTPAPVNFEHKAQRGQIEYAEGAASLEKCLIECDRLGGNCASVYFNNIDPLNKKCVLCPGVAVEDAGPGKQLSLGGVIVEKREKGALPLDACNEKKCNPKEKSSYNDQFEDLLYDRHVDLDETERIIVDGQQGIRNTVSAHQCEDACIQEVMCKSFHFTPTTSMCYMSRRRYDEPPNTIDFRADKGVSKGAVTANKKANCDAEKAYWKDPRFTDVQYGRPVTFADQSTGNAFYKESAGKTVEECAASCVENSDICKHFYHDPADNNCKMSASTYVFRQVDSNSNEKVARRAVVATQKVFANEQYESATNPVIGSMPIEEEVGTGDVVGQVGVEGCASRCSLTPDCTGFSFEFADVKNPRCRLAKRLGRAPPTTDPYNQPPRFKDGTVYAKKKRWVDGEERYQDYAYDYPPFMTTPVLQQGVPNADTCADACFNDTDKKCRAIYFNGKQCYHSQVNKGGAMDLVTIIPGSVSANIKERYRKPDSCPSRDPSQAAIPGNWRLDPACAHFNIDGNTLMCSESNLFGNWDAASNVLKSIGHDTCGSDGVDVVNGELVCANIALQGQLQGIYFVDPMYNSKQDDTYEKAMCVFTVHKRFDIKRYNTVAIALKGSVNLRSAQLKAISARRTRDGESFSLDFNASSVQITNDSLKCQLVIPTTGSTVIESMEIRILAPDIPPPLTVTSVYQEGTGAIGPQDRNSGDGRFTIKLYQSNYNRGGNRGLPELSDPSKGITDINNSLRTNRMIKYPYEEVNTVNSVPLEVDREVVFDYKEARVINVSTGRYIKGWVQQSGENITGGRYPIGALEFIADNPANKYEITLYEVRNRAREGETPNFGVEHVTVTTNGMSFTDFLSPLWEKDRKGTNEHDVRNWIINQQAGQIIKVRRIA
jgi:hypothetical protein